MSNFFMVVCLLFIARAFKMDNHLQNLISCSHAEYMG